MQHVVWTEGWAAALALAVVGVGSGCGVDSGDSGGDRADQVGELSPISEAELDDHSELVARLEVERQQLGCGGGAPATLAGEIVCYFETAGERGQFTGVDGAVIRTYAFRAEAERAALVIVGGRTESAVKYAELVYDLQVRNPQLGYSIYLLEHRGQGFSDRLLDPGPPDDSGVVYNNPDYQKGYVERFEDYVADLDTFVTDVVVPSSHPATVMLAHSMGGGIATRYLQTRAGADAITAVVLSSPMHGITDIDDQLLGPARVLALRGLIAAGFGDSYVQGSGPYAYRSFDDHEPGENSVTLSRNRYELSRWFKRSTAFAPTRIGGSTNRWVLEAHLATDAMVEDAADLRTPALVFQAGSESIVSNRRQREVCGAAPDCEVIHMVDAEHELMQERDAIRTPYLRGVVDHFEAHIAAVAGPDPVR